MRTREEQIAHLSCAIFNEKPGDIDNCISLAREYILEAERRAEQRVRAEIGRDSERLDWLLSHSHYGIPGFDPTVRGRTPLERKADLIRAIDAAREVG